MILFDHDEEKTLGSMNTQAVEDFDRGELPDAFAARNVGLAGIREKEGRRKEALNEEEPLSDKGEIGV